MISSPVRAGIYGSGGRWMTINDPVRFRTDPLVLVVFLLLY